MIRKFFSPIGCTLVFSFIIMSFPVYACTLFGAAGDYVEGGGTLMVKNRDSGSKYKQTLNLMTPEGGYRYYGLFEKGNEDSGIKMGINEKGLAVASASAIMMPELKKSKKEKKTRTRGLNRKLLTNCATVEEALSRKDLFFGARFLLVADKRQIALVEIGLDGKFTVNKTGRGVLFQANHFINPEFHRLNPVEFTPKRQARFTSSCERYGHIKNLMTKKTRYSFDDFVNISFNKDGGPNNAIWRVGDESTKVRTLSSWIVQIPQQGAPQIYVRFADPGEKIRESRLDTADIFK